MALVHGDPGYERRLGIAAATIRHRRGVAKSRSWLLIRIAVERTIGDTAEMQMSTLRVGLLASSIAAMEVLLWSGRTGHAESVSRGAEIKQVVYMYSVTEYCGLNTGEVYDGYRREVRHLTRQGGLPESTVRWLRIHGMLAADLEYDDRGLGGFRKWCRTEGLDAARHFLAFRDAQLAAERSQVTTP
jgi:hypothetical protein